MKRVLPVATGLFILFALSPLYIKRGIIRNFSNVDDYRFFDNDTVARAPIGTPWPLALSTVSPADSLLAEIESNKTIAFLVIQGDSIRYEQYWRGYEQDSYSGSFSMAKSVVSLLIGIALADGKISSIQDPISKYISAFQKQGTDSIRIRHLLAMSGGFNYTESYQNPLAKTAQMYYGDKLKALIDNLEAARPPGVTFQYSSNETQILGMILEEVYQQPLARLFSEKLWQPIGAEHPALWSTDKKGGVAKAFCCLNSNARDFARLGQLVLRKGRVDSLQLVPEEYIAEATAPASWLKDDEGNPVDFYGYQFWITSYKGVQIPYFRGVLGQFIFVIPEKDAVVVRLGEKVSRKRVHYTPPDVFTYLEAAWQVLDK